MLTYVLITVAGLGVVLAAERRQVQSVQWVAKPVASLGFVAAALWAGAFDDAYGRWLFAGLAASFAGDVLLVPKKTTLAFLLGMVAFFLAHLCYVAAFLSRGVGTPWGFLAALPLLAMMAVLLRWLWPRLAGRYRVAVPVYMAAIGAMVTCALAATLPSGRPVGLWLGAVLFFLSDLFVVRHRFVAPAFLNRALGLPLYYAGQLLLAFTLL